MQIQRRMLAAIFLVLLVLIPARAVVAAGEPLKVTLENGLTVIIDENHSAPVTAVQMWVRTGSADESDDEAGIAHVFEHMLFKGTARRKVGQIAREIESVGGSINAYTSFDNTVYHLTVPADRLATGLDIISDAIQHSSFDPVELKKELEVVIEELRMGDDSPGRNLYKSLLSAAYSRHTYGRPVIGFKKTVRSFTREKILRFFRKWYVPNNMTLVVVGDLDPARTLKEIKAAFRGFKKAPDPHRPRPIEPVQREVRLEVVAQDVNDARLGLAFHIPDARNADTYAIDVLADILGGSETSRLYRKLKIEDELVHGISAYAMTLKDPGVFFITASLESAKIERSVSAALFEIERLATEGPSYDELSRARLNIESSFVYSRETMQGVAGKLGHFETDFGDIDYERKYVDAVRKVSADDIRRVARRYLEAEAMSVAAVVPAGAKDAVTAAVIRKAIDSAAARAARVLAKRAVDAAKDGPVTRTKLENGITLIVRESHSNPTVAFYATFPGGLRFEVPAKNGVGRFTAAMLTRGTSKFSRQELSTAVEETAGSLSGFSGWNSTGVSATFLSRFFDRGLGLLAEVIENPTFPKDEIEKLRRETIAVIAQQEDYLPGYTFKLLYKELYGKHPYSMPASGTKETVSALRREDLTAHYRRFFTPSRMVLTIVGDVETAHAVERVRALFNGFKGPACKIRPYAGEEARGGIRRTGAVRDKAQTNIGIGFMGTTIGSEDSYALAVLTEVLAGQGGRLFVELRDKKGLAYSLSAFSRPGADPGIFAVFMAVAPQKKDAAIAGILGEIERIRDEEVSPQELARAKGSLTGGYLISLQSTSSRAADTANNELFGLGYDFSAKYPKLIEAVTAADVLRVARKYLTPGSYAVSIVGPGEKAGKGVSAPQ